MHEILHIKDTYAGGLQVYENIKGTYAGGSPSVRDSYISNVPTQGGSKCTRLTAIFKGSAKLSDEAESEGLVEPRKDAFSRTSGPVSHKVIWRFGNSSPSSWNDFVS